MDSLFIKTNGRNDVSLKVVLLENGLQDADSRAELAHVVTRASQQGLDISGMTLERQAEDVASGIFSATSEQISGRKGVALSRTMLQHYLFTAAKPLPGAVVWVLDDDVVLEGLVQHQCNFAVSLEIG